MAQSRALLALCLCCACAAFADVLGPDVAGTFVLRDEATFGAAPLSDFRFLPDGRLLAVERTGAVRLRRANGTWATPGTFAVDTSLGGLLAVEVDPAFATNGRLFFFLSALGQPVQTRNRVVAAQLVGEVLDTAGATVVVGDLPASLDHSGGGLAISPDGRLFVSVGEGSCGAPSNQAPTCLTSPSGKLLRVALSGGAPADNPLVGVSGVFPCGADCGAAAGTDAGTSPRADLWAWGLREARGLWVDPRTGAVWLADRGALTSEELDVVRAGAHLGAPFREGARGADAGLCASATPSSGPCQEPAYACVHSNVTPSAGEGSGCDALVGGAIADLCSWPAPLRGRYLFADGPSGNLFALAPNADRSGVSGARLAVATFAGGRPVSLQLGPGGLYVGLDVPGRIVKLSPLSPLACAEDAGVPDAGAGASDGGGGGGGGGGTGPKPACCGGSSPTDGAWNACGCTTEPGSSGTAAWWPLAVVALAFLAARLNSLKARGK